MTKTDEIRPNKSEIQFLKLSYNRFYDLFDEVMDDKFWEKDAWYRLSKIKEGFGIYSELLNYPPIQGILEKLKILRPPMESEISKDLFRFVRNVVMHFPFFEKWNVIYITKDLINWYKEGQSIGKFLEKYKGKTTVKYRFWEEKKKRMTYLSITFPKVYDNDSKIYLKDILLEKEGVKFSFILMRQVLDTQVVS